MLKALQSIHIQKLGINLKALEILEEKLDNYATAIYKSAHNTATTATSNTTATANNNKNNKKDNKNKKKHLHLSLG